MKVTPREDVCKEKIFNELFRSLAGELYRFLYYKFGSENHAEDLVQEAFTALWNNCKKVSREKAKAYLYTVANNKMINDLARKKTALKYQSEGIAIRTAESPQYILEEKEYRKRLQQALEELTEDQRTTLLLNRIEGKKHREIAELLGITPKAVEKRIYKALAILEKKLGSKV